MQLSITLKQDSEKNYLASDLGFLLHKNPFNSHEKELNFGTAHVLYPITSDEECTACLYVDIDPIDLVRNYHSPSSRKELKQYVNDRPFTANSFLSVAISRVYGTALGGTCNKKPQLAAQELPFTVELPVLPSRGGSQFVSELFEPLGYTVNSTQLPLDDAEDWGNSPYCKVVLSRVIKLSELLSHLYILIPVLDDEKHYWVGEDEIEKLVRHGGSWIPSHPSKNLIVSRYLKKQGSLKKQALKQLQVNEAVVTEIKENEIEPIDDAEVKAQKGEAKLEKSIRLNDLRIQKVTELVRQNDDITSVIDFGCGEGRYLKEFLKINKLNKVTGIEVSPSELKKAEQRLRIERLPERVRSKLELLQGSLTYFDKRTKDFDLATCIEVIEHIDEERLDAFKQTLFGYASPRMVLITTPNVEYNALFENLAKGKFRHTDHRFEWNREEFKSWCDSTAEQFDYSVSYDFIGNLDPEHGAPTQAAIFNKL